MQEQRKKWFAVFALVVFAVFYCGNTCFVHPHMVGGHIVAHSHPYFPGTAHSHSSISFETFSVFNGVAASMLDTARRPELPEPVCLCVERVPFVRFSVSCCSYSIACRAPPAV